MKRELFTIKNIFTAHFSASHNITATKRKSEWSVAQFCQIFYEFAWEGKIGRIFDFSIYCYVIFLWHVKEKKAQKKLWQFSIQIRFYISKYYWHLSFNYTIIDSLIFSWFSCLCRTLLLKSRCCCSPYTKVIITWKKKLSEEKLREK